MVGFGILGLRGQVGQNTEDITDLENQGFSGFGLTNILGDYDNDVIVPREHKLLGMFQNQQDDVDEANKGMFGIRDTIFNLESDKQGYEDDYNSRVGFLDQFMTDTGVPDEEAQSGMLGLLNFSLIEMGVNAFGLTGPLGQTLLNIQTKLDGFKAKILGFIETFSERLKLIDGHGGFLKGMLDDIYGDQLTLLEKLEETRIKVVDEFQGIIDDLRNIRNELRQDIEIGTHAEAPLGLGGTEPALTFTTKRGIVGLGRAVIQFIHQNAKEYIRVTHRQALEYILNYEMDDIEVELERRVELITGFFTKQLPSRLTDVLESMRDLLFYPMTVIKSNIENSGEESDRVTSLVPDVLKTNESEKDAVADAEESAGIGVDSPYREENWDETLAWSTKPALNTSYTP